MTRSLLALLLLAAPLVASAAEPPMPPPLRTSGGTVELPWNDFETLYRRGLAPATPPDPAAPRAWTLDRAAYVGRVVGTGDDAHAAFRLTLRGEVLLKEGWSTIPLLSTTAALRSAKIGGKDAPIFIQNGWYTLITDQPGPFVAELDFATSLFTADGDTGLSLPMAASGATEVAFTMESAEDVDFEVAGSRGLVVNRQGSTWRLDAAVPSVGSLAISWQRALPDERELAPRVYAESHVLVGVGEGVLQGSATVHYTVLHKGIDRLQVQVPSDVTVLDVTAPGLREWAQAPDGTVTVALNHEALGAVRVDLQYERALAGDGQVAVPLVRALGVAREKAWIGVDARSALELVAGQATGATPVDVRELPAAVVGRTDYPVLLAWKARGGDVSIPLEVRSHPDVDMLVTLLDTAVADTLVTPDGRRMTRVRYAVRNNRNQFLRLAMPTGAEIWSAAVAGRGVKVAKGDDGGVLVPLVRSDAAGGALTAFLVELIYVEEGAALEDGRGELKVDLPRASAPISQLQWSVWFPQDAKVKRGSFEGTVEHVPYFSTAPQLPQEAVAADVAQQVGVSAQRQDEAGALGQGVEPVRVDLPLTGQVQAFEKMLVLDEPLWVSFDYANKRR